MSVNEEQSFLTALEAAPEEDATWQVYADWLEERGDPRAPFLRLSVALALGAVAPEEVEAAARRLQELAGPLNQEWVQRCARLRAARPTRFRITGVSLEGGWAPRTVLHGVLESGRLRVSEGVEIPLEGSGTALAWPYRLLSEGSTFREVRAGKEPLAFDLACAGQRPGILRHGVVVRSAEADAELQRRLDLSLAELELGTRATNCLRSVGIATLRDLVIRNEAELLETRSFGETTLREAKSRLAPLGLELGMDLGPFHD